MCNQCWQRPQLSDLRLLWVREHQWRPVRLPVQWLFWKWVQRMCRTGYLHTMVTNWGNKMILAIILKKSPKVCDCCLWHGILLFHQELWLLWPDGHQWSQVLWVRDHRDWRGLCSHGEYQSLSPFQSHINRDMFQLYSGTAYKACTDDTYRLASFETLHLKHLFCEILEIMEISIGEKQYLAIRDYVFIIT